MYEAMKEGVTERITAAEAQLCELTAERDEEFQRAEAYGRIAANYLNEKYDLEAKVRELRSTIERLEGELRRFTALEAHLPPGYAVGDDATAELAVKLAEVERQLAELRSEKK